MDNRLHSFFNKMLAKNLRCVGTQRFFLKLIPKKFVD